MGEKTPFEYLQTVFADLTLLKTSCNKTYRSKIVFHADVTFNWLVYFFKKRSNFSHYIVIFRSGFTRNVLSLT